MAGYIGTQAVSVNTTSATISDDLAVGDDLTVTDDATIGGTALVTGVLTTTAAAVFNGGFTSNADTNTFTSGNASDPLVIIKNTANDASGARLSFQKDKGANAADGDDIGTITFIGDNNAQEQTNYGSIVVEVSESQNTDEAGKMSFFVSESNGTAAQLTAGLIIEGEHATDGQVDVTLAAGAASTTTIAGTLTSTGLVTATSLNVTAGLASGTGVGASGANGNLRLYSNGTQSVTVDTSGHVIIADGNLVIDTAGHGINFQAYGAGTGIDSNLLDDYEEGTFTPTLSIGGTALASTGGVGRYTKVGRKVYIEGSVTRNTANGGNGTLIIHALPFTILNANSIGVQGAGTMWMDAGGPSTGFGDTVAFVYAAGGQTYFQAVRATSTGAVTASRYGQAEKLANNRPVYFNFSYTTA